MSCIRFTKKSSMKGYSRITKEDRRFLDRIGYTILDKHIKYKGANK